MGASNNLKSHVVCMNVLVISGKDHSQEPLSIDGCTPQKEDKGVRSSCILPYNKQVYTQFPQCLRPHYSELSTSTCDAQGKKDHQSSLGKRSRGQRSKCFVLIVYVKIDGSRYGTGILDVSFQSALLNYCII